MKTFSNQIENRILIVGTALIMIAAFIVFQIFFVKPVYEAQLAGLRKQVEINNKLIEQLASDPKYAIQNDFGKMKPKKGSVIELDLNNTLDVDDSRITSNSVYSDDTILAVKEKKSFWRKLFK